MVKLGNKVRDMITGFTGIATGRTEYLYGCARILVEPDELKDGKPVEAGWFDEQRIETVVEKAIPVSAENSATSGGPQSAPTRSPNPTR